MQTAFDFIVVGGGSAGCVVAARLAQDGRFTVALVEEGRPDTNRWIHVPATFFRALQSRDATAVVSEPDPTLDGRDFVVPQGRVLGGGSSVNGMIYMRGQAADYAGWVQDYGCDGWGYDDVLPMFCAQERNMRLGAPYHGQSGPLVVADPAYRHPVTAQIIASAQNAGLPANDDFNGARQDGVGWYQITADGGRRKSASVCFLGPVREAETLTLLTGCTAQRVLFSGRRATGVAIRTPEGETELSARHEVVLTAGSFHSPKLLMLSGIGPGDNLRRFGVDVIAEADNVGANYQDHVGAPVTMRLRQGLGLHGADRGLKALRHGFDYWVLGRGLLTSNLLEGGACADTDGDGRPDVQFNLAPFAPGAPGQPPLPFDAVQVHPMTMRPKSRGRVFLASADAAAKPGFRARVLDAEEDVDTLRRGVRLAREIFACKPLADLVTEEVWPGPDVSAAVGSNRLDTAIRAHARTIFHPAGTCRMGPDPSAVVDTKCRVNGVDGLRVADCSVMPALVSGNTNAPTMMIAGRAAEWILKDA